MDELTRLTLRVIALETSLEKLKMGEFQSHTQLERINGLEARIKVLEDARARQISYNTEVGNRLTKLEKPAEKPKFWPWQH